MDNLKVTFEIVPTDDLTYDKDNPRIAKWSEMYPGDITAEQMALALGAGSREEGDSGSTFTSLRQSIRTHRGIIHPIIVRKVPGGKSVVIEGNTRLMIYREFAENNTEGDWSKIPAMVYENISTGLIDAIRLQAHLVGARQWDPYSKAKYIDLLYDGTHLTVDQIIDFCGGSKREVINYLEAYRDMEKYYRPILEDEGEFDPTRFSAFIELQKGNVAEVLIGKGFTKTDFSKWVNERKLFPLETVRKLPRILQNEESKKAFLKYGAGEAIKLLDAPSPEAALGDATLDQLTREIYDRINRMSYPEMLRLRSDPDSDEVATLFDARDMLVGLCRDITSEDSR
ncbi:ParB N-terminal domain-containing protein [Chloroflexota bacterium]